LNELIAANLAWRVAQHAETRSIKERKDILSLIPFIPAFFLQHKIENKEKKRLTRRHIDWTHKTIQVRVE
jgi:hypothetical protein